MSKVKEQAAAKGKGGESPESTPTGDLAETSGVQTGSGTAGALTPEAPIEPPAPAESPKAVESPVPPASAPVAKEEPPSAPPEAPAPEALPAEALPMSADEQEEEARERKKKENRRFLNENEEARKMMEEISDTFEAVFPGLMTLVVERFKQEQKYNPFFVDEIRKRVKAIVEQPTDNIASPAKRAHAIPDGRFMVLDTKFVSFERGLTKVTKGSIVSLLTHGRSGMERMRDAEVIDLTQPLDK